MLSLISYARQLMGPLRRELKGIAINEQLYEDPVPTGLLPLDMNTENFIREAETRLGSMNAKRHFPCFLYKRRLLKTMSSKFTEQPEYRLFYVRTMIEMYVHQFAAGDLRGVARELPRVIEDIKTVEVTSRHNRDKQLLVEYASSLLQRSIASCAGVPKAPKTLTLCFGKTNGMLTAKEK